jgi:hypothetical protein
VSGFDIAKDEELSFIFKNGFRVSDVFNDDI